MKCVILYSFVLNKGYFYNAEFYIFRTQLQLPEKTVSIYLIEKYKIIHIIFMCQYNY